MESLPLLGRVSFPLRTRWRAPKNAAREWAPVEDTRAPKGEADDVRFISEELVLISVRWDVLVQLATIYIFITIWSNCFVLSTE